MTVLEVIQRSTEFLARKGIESPRLQVELLLGHALKMPRLRLYLDFERQLTEVELNTARELIKRRANREPLQHILGSASFCGLEILVNENVLIPRPETEVLAEHGWQFLAARAEQRQSGLLALDFGTGSGCLSLALAAHVPQLRVHSLDVSKPALEVARENAKRLGFSERIEFILGDGFQVLPEGARYDLILSNPPYIPSAEIEQLAPEVRDYDPRLALDGGEDGLHFYRSLAAGALGFLASGGKLMCELGDGQAESVSQIFRERAWQIDAILPDLSGRARILVACRPES